MSTEPTGQPAGEPTTESAGKPAGESTGKPTTEATTETTTEATGQKAKTTETTTETTSWRDKIEDKQLKSFADKFTSEEDLAKAALQFRQKLSNAISLPGKDATEEEIKEFNKKIGVPDSPKDYGIKIPELPEDMNKDNLESSVNNFADILHKAGATNGVAKAVMDHFFEMVTQAYEDEGKESEKYKEQSLSQLKKDWGEDYDINLEYARRAAKQFGDDEFSRVLEEAKLDGMPIGNHPAFSRIFANIGRKMGEGGLQIVMTDDDKQGTEQKLDELTEKAHAAMNNGDRSTADRLFKERDQIAKQFYG